MGRRKRIIREKPQSVKPTEEETIPGTGESNPAPEKDVINKDISQLTPDDLDKIEGPSGSNETSKIPISDISDVSMFKGEPQEQRHANTGASFETGQQPPPAAPGGLFSDNGSDGNKPNEEGKTGEQPPIQGDFKEEIPPPGGEQFNETPGGAGISPEQAKQTFDFIVDQYQYFSKNVLPQLPLMSAKPTASIHELPAPVAESISSDIENYNQANFEQIALSQEEITSVEKPAIIVIQKQAQKITPEDQLKYALILIGFKKVSVIVRMVRAHKIVMQSIDARIKEAIMEFKAMSTERSGVLNEITKQREAINKERNDFNAEKEAFKNRMAEFVNQQIELKQMMDDFKKAKSEVPA